MKNILAAVITIVSLTLNAAWQDAVSHDFGGGWEMMPEQLVYSASAGWKYLPEANCWIYVVEEQEPVPAGYVRIDSGNFLMGSLDADVGRYADELPKHEVTLSRSFYMRQTEVTNADAAAIFNWALDEGLVAVDNDALVNQQGSQEILLPMKSYTDNRMIYFDGTDLIVESGTENLPCINISWYGAVAYCNYLSDYEGKERAFSFVDWSVDLDSDGYRLPIEAEWEYACRGGTDTAFYTGGITPYADAEVDPNLNVAGWYTYNSQNPDNEMLENKGTHVVGLKQANAWDLYDMHGNVQEWCLDPKRVYESGSVTDPVGTSAHAVPERVIRGGSFYLSNTYCRSAKRTAKGPDWADDTLGFRPVRTVVW